MTLRENIRCALTATTTWDCMALHRMLMAERAWPVNGVFPYRTKPSKKKNPGLVKDAATLGVSYQLLYSVLRGRKKTHPLTARYNQLKEAR